MMKRYTAGTVIPGIMAGYLLLKKDSGQILKGRCD